MIEFVKGDATIPSAYDKSFVNVIVHVNNDIGAWGKGFVVPLEFVSQKLNWLTMNGESHAGDSIGCH